MVLRAQNIRRHSQPRQGASPAVLVRWSAPTTCFISSHGAPRAPEAFAQTQLRLSLPPGIAPLHDVALSLPSAETRLWGAVQGASPSGLLRCWDPPSMALHELLQPPASALVRRLILRFHSKTAGFRLNYQSDRGGIPGQEAASSQKGHTTTAVAEHGHLTSHCSPALPQPEPLGKRLDPEPRSPSLLGGDFNSTQEKKSATWAFLLVP